MTSYQLFGNHHVSNVRGQILNGQARTEEMDALTEASQGRHENLMPGATQDVGQPLPTPASMPGAMH
jgi:hypothetical protein